jgi:2-isopropylmalate synthase
MKIGLIDSTFREGKQSVCFSEIIKIKGDYLRLIQKMGVLDVEYGNPFTSEKDFSEYKILRKKFPRINFYVHIFLSKENVERLEKEKIIDCVSPFVRLPLSQEDKTNLEKLFSRKTKKLRVSVENASGTNYTQVKKFVEFLSKEKQVTRIGFSDTLSLFTPKKIDSFIQKISKCNIKNKEVEFHLHNDYGLASANAFQIMSNPNKFKNIYFSVSIFGVGERNGILSHGDVLANLTRVKVKHELNLKEYGKISPKQFGVSEKFLFNKFTDKKVFVYIIERFGKSKTKDKEKVIEKILSKMDEKYNGVMDLEQLISLLNKYFD